MKNDDLLGKKGGQGFPHLVFMDADGEVLATHEEAREIDAFTKTADKAKEARELKAKAAQGDPEAQFDWLMMQLDSGTVGSADAQARVKTMKLSEAQQKLLDRRLFDAEVLDLSKTMQSEEDVPAAAKKILAWVEQKKIPHGDSAFDFYWQILAAHGDKTKDPKVFGMALDLVKDRFGDNPRYTKMLEGLGQRLEELKKEKKDDKKEEKKEGKKGG